MHVHLCEARIGCRAHPRTPLPPGIDGSFPRASSSAASITYLTPRRGHQGLGDPLSETTMENQRREIRVLVQINQFVARVAVVHP